MTLAPTPSRPPRLALGIEIGGTKLQTALVDTAGVVHRRSAGSVDHGAGAEGIRAVLARQLAEALDAVGERRGAIVGVGIGFGGPVDRRAGVVAHSFHVGGWGRFPLAEWVRARLAGVLADVPVHLENDANAAALAEATVGAGRGHRVVFYTNAGSGIGAGLTVDGRLYHGRHSGEMELGHVRLAPDGGILEERASGWAIDRAVAAEVRRDPGGILGRGVAAGAAPTARCLPAALAVGDPAATQILSSAAGHYAHALSHVVHLLNPDLIVLGGGVAAIGEPWRAAVADRLAGLLMRPLCPPPPVVLAALGEDVVPVGAALVACGPQPDGP